MSIWEKTEHQEEPACPVPTLAPLQEAGEKGPGNTASLPGAQKQADLLGIPMRDAAGNLAPPHLL